MESSSSMNDFDFLSHSLIREGYSMHGYPPPVKEDNLSLSYQHEEFALEVSRKGWCLFCNAFS